MANAGITRDVFGTLPDGRAVERVVLHGASGFEARIISFGAVLQALIVPDRGGRCDDIVFGHDNLAGYVERRQFFGATVGRYANRIANGRFELDGETIQLATNNGPNALHGGPDGFDRKLWQILEIDEGAQPAVTLHYVSPSGEENYPGRLDVRLTYRLTSPTELSIAFEARTDRPTVVNLTNHSFFNLEGLSSLSNVLDHELMIAADAFLAVDETSIPLPGPPRAVEGTPFDFRQPTAIGARIRGNDRQLRDSFGYDHNYCLRDGDGVRLAARVTAPRSGRVLELLTDQPGVQFYSGNYLNGGSGGKGLLYRQSDAFCLEPQVWPNTPNRPDFPSARLAPDQVYRHHSVYRFSISGAAATKGAAP
jgi:aldose 1-epimerase